MRPKAAARRIEPMKYLGVKLTERFKFNDHVSRRLKKDIYALHSVQPLMKNKN